MRSYNINYDILVKITEEGYEYLSQKHTSFFKNIGVEKLHDTSVQYYKNKADENGYTKYQLWEFMNDFGIVTYNGMKHLYELDIILCNID